MTRLALTTLAALGTAYALPDGFEIHTFAEPFDADYPTAITVAPNGDVYVSSDQDGSLGHDPNMGRIIRCRDTNHDGKADEFIHFVPDVSSPRGGHIVGDTLYLIHPPYLSSYRDTNGDGVADEEKLLISGLGGGIEHPRGADHTTNGVRMGIDGWLYISCGDFGTTPAKGADGKTYTLHGGGVLRVRPDGSELEPYDLMTRNICDTAISPTLDLFSRDNTNDGKGWNTRFHYYTQLGNHGYPRLYKNFPDEAIQPLDDYGGGSGTGMLWVDEPGFPENFGNMLYSCDWTTGHVYYHPNKRVGSSYEIEQKDFLSTPHAIDIDVDGFSRLYIADWRNGSFAYAGKGKKVGLIQQVTIKDIPPAQYEDVTQASDKDLIRLLTSKSAVQRLQTQREILKRNKANNFADQVYTLAADAKQSIEVRVAAIFTYKQLIGKSSTLKLAKLVDDPAVREYALRAITDRLSELDGVPSDIYVKSLKDPNPRVALRALIGLDRLHTTAAAPAIIAASTTWHEDGVSPRLLHTATTVLSDLDQIEPLLDGAKSPSTRKLCLRALAMLHEPKVVDGLIALVEKNSDADLQFDTLMALARLNFQEGEWDYKSWWGTRPDDRGPYFDPVEWNKSETIRKTLEQGFLKISKQRQGEYLSGLAANRLEISKLNLPGLDPVMAALGIPTPDDHQIILLVNAAKDPKQPFSRRLECYKAISRGDERKITPNRIEVLASWSQEKDLPSEVAQHIGDFVNETLRGSQLDLLRQIAAKGNDAVSTIAWKAILTVINSPLAKKPWKEAAKKMADQNPHEVGFFNAIADLKLQGYDKQIEAGLSFDNEELISAAKRAKAATNNTASNGKKVGEMKPEEVMKVIMTSAGKGDLTEGQRLFTAQGCVACHSIDPAAAQKGPYLGAAGSQFTRDYLIESVLNPNAVVSQGFQTRILTTKDGQTNMGFVVGETDGVIEMRNITGQVTHIKREDVASEKELPQSMMPVGLPAGLTIDQFNSLIDYLSSLKSKK